MFCLFLIARNFQNPRNIDYLLCIPRFDLLFRLMSDTIEGVHLLLQLCSPLWRFRLRLMLFFSILVVFFMIMPFIF